MSSNSSSATALGSNVKRVESSINNWIKNIAALTSPSQLVIDQDVYDAIYNLDAAEASILRRRILGVERDIIFSKDDLLPCMKYEVAVVMAAQPTKSRISIGHYYEMYFQESLNRVWSFVCQHFKSRTTVIAKAAGVLLLGFETKIVNDMKFPCSFKHATFKEFSSFSYPSPFSAGFILSKYKSLLSTNNSMNKIQSDILSGCR